jgi:tetratricopeptide (TPR) repeat protein
VDLEPSEENAWTLGEELLRHWTFAAAAVEFDAAAHKFPDSARLRAGLGAAYFGDMKYALAIPVFADLLVSFPDSASYASMLGMSCEAVTDVSRPRCSALLQYAQSHVSDARASIWAAQFLLRKSGSEAPRPTVESLIRAALKADPDLPEAQFYMGSFLQDDGHWAESIPYFERAVSLRPQYAQAHYRLALACWRTGRKQEGEVQMELMKKYSHEDEEQRDNHLKQIVTFVVDIDPEKKGDK